MKDINKAMSVDRNALFALKDSLTDFQDFLSAIYASEDNEEIDQVMEVQNVINLIDEFL